MIRESKYLNILDFHLHAIEFCDIICKWQNFNEKIKFMCM
jgi:hypothetical protein